SKYRAMISTRGVGRACGRQVDRISKHCAVISTRGVGFSGNWRVEGGGLLTARLLKFESQISNLPNPSFPKEGLSFRLAPLARKGEFIFCKKKTTVFSLFRKRGKAKQGLKKLDVDNRDGDLNFNPRGR
ncbi:MAG: hypothetical protein ABIE14_05695, partial [Patescibacteria group bacterium]